MVNYFGQQSAVSGLSPVLKMWSGVVPASCSADFGNSCRWLPLSSRRKTIRRILNVAGFQWHHIMAVRRLGGCLSNVKTTGFDIFSSFFPPAVFGSLSIGGGATITKHLSAATTWDPVSISNNTSTSTTVTVTGAHIGDTVTVGFSAAVPADALLVGSVTATNTVTVTLFNNTGSALDLVSGTLRADVWQH